MYRLLKYTSQCFISKVLVITSLYLFLSVSLLAQQPAVEAAPKVGLSLSGGGARAFAQIGVIKVLEEQGIQIDYVSGSSMGAIIGGLYAMGYSIQDIEQMALSEDWSALLSDDTQRKYLSMAEKRIDAQAFLTLPIKNYNLSMPAGLISGQQFNQFLSKVCIPASRQHNFRQLYRPFCCRATDLLSGKSVKIEQGSLALSMRASSSVPSIFVPLKYQGMYLVDGGVFNNYPVLDCKAMGADYVIGVNTQTPLYREPALHNMVNILRQSVFFNAELQNKLNEKAADINMVPNVHAYSNTDFEKVADIIAEGETYAREHLPEILAWIKDKRIGMQAKQQMYNQFPQIYTLYVDSVSVVGNESISDKYILKNLNIKPGQPVSLKDLDRRISYLYGSLLFSSIYYHINNNDEGKHTIVIEVDEGDFLNFSFGAHYNDYSKTAILLRVQRRRMGLPNGLLDVSVALGRASRFKAAYIVDNVFLPGFGAELSSLDQYGYTYDKRGYKKNKFDIAEFSFKMYAMMGISNVLRTRIGGTAEGHTVRRNISFSNFNKINNIGFHLFADIEYDDYDKKYFPTQGGRLYALLEKGRGHSDVVSEDGQNTDIHNVFYNYSSLEISYSRVFSILPWLRLRPHIYLRNVWADKPLPIPKLSHFGGANQSYLHYYKPFYGYDFQAIQVHNPLLGSLRIDCRVYKSHYASIESQLLLPSFAYSASGADDHLRSEYYNWRLVYTYNSTLGPLSLSVAKAYPKQKLMLYLNLGFWF